MTTSSNSSNPLRVFLSAVTSDLGKHREMLRLKLNVPWIQVQEQQGLVRGGGKLLETLDDYILKSCDVVVHLVGCDTGQYVKQDEVAWLLEHHEQFTVKFPFLIDDLKAEPPSITYTQLEAWLAFFHKRPCFIYQSDEMKASSLPDDHPQQKHWLRLKGRGQHRGSFSDAPTLCIEVLRDLGTRQLLIQGGVARFSPLMISASLIIIIGLLGGIWATIIRSGNNQGLNSATSGLVSASRLLFSREEVAEDVERLAAAQVYDALNLARECHNPILAQLANQLKQQPEEFLRFVRTYIAAQKADPKDLLSLTNADKKKLATATEASVVSQSQACDNLLIRKLAIEFSTERKILLLIIQELSR